MKIGSVSSNYFTSSPISNPAAVTETGNRTGDTFVVDKTNSAVIYGLNSFLKGSKADLLGEIEAIQNTDAKPQTEGRVFRITEDGVKPMEKQADGSYLIDEETGAKAFVGENAKQFLKNTTHFDKETEVIIPTGTTVDTTHERECLSVAEPGAIMIGAGSDAKVKVHEGNVLVTQIDRAPSWYQKVKPEGEMKAEFDRIVDRNQRLFSCAAAKSRFSPEDLNTMMSVGVISQDDKYPDSVKWDSSITSSEKLESRLIAAGMSGEAVEKNSKIWYNTIKRKLYATSSGHAHKSSFSEDQLQKLIDAKIVKPNTIDKINVYWTQYTNEQGLRGKLDEAGIHGQEADSVVDVWKKTNRSGYDNTGLTWDKGKVVAYLLREKQNIWNEQNTEWIVNSTEYAGKNEPFTVGASEVKSTRIYSEPAPFHDIRPSEKIHRHPVRDGKKQTESYLVTSGEAALLTIRDGQPTLTFMKQGDMAVISPGIAHCVLAMNGDYEHICFQVPSAFQYGFLFKDELNYESFNTDEKVLLDAALKGLNKGMHGTFDLDSIKREN
ncbi:MAG: hypothetical protein LWY06_00930 [Firmicutes bacterium]|nr:hypothetical protein [Bacillota bacterium]